jgi:hypothetical protein
MLLITYCQKLVFLCFATFVQMCTASRQAAAQETQEPHPACWTVDERSHVAVNAALWADTAIRVIDIHTRGHETGIWRTDLQNTLFRYEIIGAEKSQMGLTDEVFDVKCCTRNVQLISLLLDRPSEISEFLNYPIREDSWNLRSVLYELN